MKVFLNRKYHFYLLVALLFILTACGDTGGSNVARTETEEIPTDAARLPNDSLATDEGEVNLPEDHWFLPQSSLLAYWDIMLDQGDPSVVSLIPRNQAGTSVRKILFLYTRPNIAFDEAVAQVLSTFREKGVVVEANVILSLLGDETEGEKAGLDALVFAEARNFDLVYSVGSSTTAFIHENYQGGSIPIVSLLSKDPVLLGQMPDYFTGSHTNIAYTSVSVPSELQMTYFLELVPNLYNIIILYEQNNVSTVATQVEPLDAYAVSNNVNVIHVPIIDPEKTRTELEDTLPKVVFQIYHMDPEVKGSILLVTNSGSIVDEFDTVNRIAGKIPVVTLRPELVQEGIESAVLSVGLTFESNAILAAIYGYRILEDGVPPGELPVGVITPPDIAINFAKAREIGLKIPFSFFESATIIYGPDGSLVRGRGQ